MGSKVFTYPDEVTEGTYTLSCSPSGCYGGCGPFPGVVRHRAGSYAGVSTPHYYERKKRGELLPLNAYVRSDVDQSGEYAGSISFHYSELECGGADCTGTLSFDRRGWLVEPQSDSSPEDLQAGMYTQCNTTALLQRAASDALPDLDALTTIMEAHKTVDMVLHARSNAKRLLTQALRGGKHTVKAAAKAWLEWRYGWRQLGFDIESCVKAYNTPKRQFVSGRAGESGPQGVTSWSGRLPFCSSTTTAWFDYLASQEVDISYRANVIGKYQVESVNQLYSPVNTAWEEIPFSWVADWFVSVGDAIAAWVIKSSLAEVYCSLGVKATVTVNARVTGGHTINTCHDNPTGSGSSLYWSQTMARWPSGYPSLKPQFRVRLTGPRLLDAASLLLTRIL